jgi:carbon monoxide dehydrogenase subunit G
VERINVVDDRTAELTVKEKVGVVPLILTLRAQIDAEEPPRRLHATAKAEHLTMAIDVTLRDTASGTELLSLFDVKGEGQLKAIVDRLFERRATERTAQFADCLGKRFGAVAAGQPPAVKGAEGFRQWLARVWRRLLAHFAPARK